MSTTLILSPPAFKPKMVIATINNATNDGKLHPTIGIIIKQIAGPPNAIVSKSFRENVSDNIFFY